jgi:glycosyltransferase involved in cell wall biosynthesis
MHDRNTALEAKTPVAMRTRTAIVIPCHNEAAAIAETIAAFRAALPEADIYVYDNASSDDTARVARDAGAHVRTEPRKGKGNVVRRMFADIEADIYVLVDGDNTYEAAAARDMIELLERDRLDMVIGVRVQQEAEAYRRGHRFGNLMLTGLVATVFGHGQHDILSGYRAMSRRFVKSFPALSKGFEIETELSVHALEVLAPIGERPVAYNARPEGSVSKLNTIRDGLRILRLIIHLTRDERPLPFFGAIALILALVSALLAIPVLVSFFETGLVPRLPTWVFATGLGILAMLSLSVGLVLDTVTRGRREMKRLIYLGIPR